MPTRISIIEGGPVRGITVTGKLKEDHDDFLPPLEKPDENHSNHSEHVAMVRRPEVGAGHDRPP
jgi:hypothetical protein